MAKREATWHLAEMKQKLQEMSLFPTPHLSSLGLLVHVIKNKQTKTVLTLSIYDPGKGHP